MSLKRNAKIETPPPAPPPVGCISALSGGHAQHAAPGTRPGSVDGAGRVVQSGINQLSLFSSEHHSHLICLFFYLVTKPVSSTFLSSWTNGHIMRRSSREVHQES